MRKIRLGAVLLLSGFLLAGCAEREKIPSQSVQSSEAGYHGEDVTPENLADQVTVESIVPYEGIFLEGDEKERVEDEQEKKHIDSYRSCCSINVYGNACAFMRNIFVYRNVYPA